MAKHFVAVCVVCLLCVEHLPCKEHIIGESDTNPVFVDGAGTQYDIGTGPNAVAGHSSEFILQSHTRWKRHRPPAKEVLPEAGTEKAINENARRYLAKIFDQFGNGDGINLGGFERMLDHLGLTKMIVDRSKGEAVHEDNQTNACISSLDLVTRISPNAYKVAHQMNPDLSRLQKRAVATATATAANELNLSNRQPISDNLNYKDNSSSTNVDNSVNRRSDINNGSSSYGAASEIPPQQMVANKTDDDRLRQLVRLDANDLFQMCPILLHQLILVAADNRTNVVGGGCISADALDSLPESLINDRYSGNDHVIIEDAHGDRKLVWIYASLSIFGVSLCGLLGVAVIPCMEKKFYHQILQFLVALAVGTLAGDALLHLMPHAMLLTVEASSSSGSDIHTALTLKGLVAVCAIVAFFAIERALTMIAEWRKQRQKKQKVPARVRVLRDPETTSLNNSEKLCKNKYSSYPYCYDEIAMDTKDDHHHHHGGGAGAKMGGVTCESGLQNALGNASNGGQVYKHNTILPVMVGGNGTVDPMLSHYHEEPQHLDHSHNYHQHNNHGSTTQICESNGMNGIKSTGSNNTNNSNNNHVMTHNHSVDTNTMSTTTTMMEDSNSVESSKMLQPVAKISNNNNNNNTEECTVILREHESKHHGHSHTHGHVHSPPGSLSAVAWMVVMGDGLHNFTDGMAIGAAFSNDIAGGFSTAIAVFCHELPHELGDFAVLLKAGMSAKQAVYYNLLSSILSFFGMVLGIAIGDTPEASAWIFSIAAGLFLYIALVDMVPELTSSHQMRFAASNTLLQVLGMVVGLGIMLLIALNEHDLKSLFNEGGDNHEHNHHH